MERPRQRISPESTSMTRPPRALFGRQPAISSDSPRAVTYLGRPSTIARPFKWQRSDGSSTETKGGRHLGAKLADRSIVHRQENRVLTNHNSLPIPQAIS